MTVQSLPFENLITIDRRSSMAVFQQIANAMIHLIRDGILKPGFHLPSTRVLAGLLKMNRTTVVAAYEELKVQGWIEMADRKGVFVSKQLPLLRPRSFRDRSGENLTSAPVLKFYRKVTEETPPDGQRRAFELLVNDGYPDAPLSVIAGRYKTLLDRSYKHGVVMNERPSGASSLREELSFFLSQTRGLNITTDNLLVTRGAQVAIYIAAQLIIKPGSKVIVGDLNYSLANKIFKDLGATLIKVNVDENGIDVDMIESICKVSRPDLLYIIPHHHHPTTVTLSAERRMKLLQIIRTYQLPVIEDDYDYDFHYDNSPILPLASADHQDTCYTSGPLPKHWPLP